jgi:AraC family transcriptional regulator
MFNEGIKSNYNKPINEVFNFILTHLKDDLSLKRLAEVANYSPFHFQKVFKQAVGTTPKQFIIKTKLEHAGFLIVHQNKPIAEIAVDCGFSSPSVFARSFKNYFGLSAEELRNVPGKERIKFLKNDSVLKALLNRGATLAESKHSYNLTAITVKKINAIHGIFTNTSLQSSKIINSFRKSIQIAETINADISNCNYIGIIYPHQDLYRALITLHSIIAIPKKENFAKIDKGRYATFKVNGTIEKTFSAIHFFYEHWLPNSGYQVADIWIFEILSQNPVGRSYNEIEREVYIPIEPAK